MLRSRLPQIVVKLEVVVDEALERAVEDVRDAAEARLEPHRRTGRLAEETHVHKEPEGFYVVAGDDEGDVFWGHMLEHGTSHSAPYPFLVPSLEERRDGIITGVQVALRNL